MTYADTHIRLRGAQLKLYQPYLCLFHSRWSASALHNLLIQHQSINHLGILYRSPEFFDDSDVLEINVICCSLVYGFQHRIDSYWTEEGGMLRNYFG